MQICISLCIGGLTAGGIVLFAIQFDHQFGGGTVKVYTLRTDHFLAVNGLGKGLEKVVPQMPFFLCHIPPQSLRILPQVGGGVRHKISPLWLPLGGKLSA